MPTQKGQGGPGTQDKEYVTLGQCEILRFAQNDIKENRFVMDGRSSRYTEQYMDL
jgi:hypothetical protein